MPEAPTRVAVIVTPGVGDDARGGTLDGFVDGLVRHRHFATATSDDVVVPPPVSRPPLAPGVADPDWVAPPTSSTTVARRRLRRAAGDDTAPLEVDAYEMHWADISRFPVGMRRIVFTLFALILELSRMGHEALVGLGPSEGNGPLRAARLSLRTFAIWMALAVLPVTALLGFLGVAVWVATLAPSTTVAWLFVVAVALVALGLLIWVGWALARSGWTRGDRMTFAAWPALVALAAVGIGLIGLAITGEGNPFVADSVPVGLANLLLAVAAWPLRIVWVALVVLWICSALWVLVLMFRSGSTETPAWRGGFVALISTSLPAVLLGISSAVILATTGILALQSLGGRDWGTADSELLCLTTPDAWQLSSCAGLELSDEGRISPTDWLLDLFGTILEPLGVTAAMLLGLLVVVVLVIALKTVASLLVSRGKAMVPAAISRFVPLLAIGRFLPGVGGVAEAIGPALSRGLRAPSSRTGVIVLTSISGAIAAITLCSWLLSPVSSWPVVEQTLGGWGADFAGAGSALVAVIVLGVRFLPGSLSKGGTVGPIRQGLDVIWDVTNYVRPHSKHRLDIVSRYRALIDRVMEMPHADGTVGYAGLVLASHSQGTVYTAATLFGDGQRTPKILGLDELADRDRLAELEAQGGVAMLTLGSPIRQTYDRYFADQYRDWYRRSGDDLAPISTAWVNGFRPADYVGRGVHVDPLAEASLVPGPVDPEGTFTGADVREVALDSPKAHTGYWSEKEVARLTDELIQAVVTKEA